MTETTDRKPRRSAKEIAQAHADKAVAALEKHDEKINKLNDKIEGLQDQLAELRSQRRDLERESDYRQAHPLLAEPAPESDDEFNPFD